MATKDKVLLAYSGGLDTSCILKWLIDEGYEVLAFLANVGQEEDFEAARAKALKIGATKVFIEDLRKEFVEEFIYPCLQSNLLYESIYPLGTSMARPVIARRQVQIATEEGCRYVSHGCTGKGNDQVRFELTYYAINPKIEVIAPWRVQSFLDRFRGRSDLLAFAAASGIPVQQTAAKPWSTDENMFHISYEAGVLEDPNHAPPADMYKLTADPTTITAEPDILTISFAKGNPVKVVNRTDGTEAAGSLEVFNFVNNVARRQGVGRIDIVENRFIGVKSRGVYETPAGTVLRSAHLDLEGLVMDREVRKLRDSLMPRLAEIVYNGFWFSPEREMIQVAVNFSQQVVNGDVTVKCTRGHVYMLGRTSPDSLYDQELSSMDVAGGFVPQDSEGFIKIQSIRLKAHHRHAQRKRLREENAQ